MTAYIEEGHRADLARWALGPVGLARARSARAHVSRVANRDGRNLVLHLQKRGRLTLVSGDEAASVGVGDVIVADDRYPYAIDISEGNECLIVQVPVTLFDAEHDVEGWHGRVLSCTSANVAFLGHMIMGLWNRPDMISELDGSIGQVLVEAVRTVLYSEREGDTPPATLSPIEYTLAHLDDPDLGTAMICEATGLSSRAVQKTFIRAASRTPTAFISERRLFRAADLLADSDEGMTVTEVAYAVGYNDAAYFSRKFRDYFGMAPSQYREAKLRRH